jgi:antirestriction protein ArdC
MIKNNLKYMIKSKEDKQQEMNTIIKTLEDGVRDVFSSEKYKRYLEFCGKFHHYSFNNIMLILIQCPNAQMCASYTTWKSLKMKVRKGEKGIKILCPIPYSYKRKDHFDEYAEEEIVNAVGFKIGHVFDISQVDGDMPTLADELTDNPDNLNDIIEKLIASSPVPVTYDKRLTKNNGNGYYDMETKSIALRAGMSSLQTFKTLVHEIAHSIMHDKKYPDRKAEVEAESVAFVVCSTLGLDTSNYSFEYIASWSSDKELKELKASLSVIERTSRKLLKDIIN